MLPIFMKTFDYESGLVIYVRKLEKKEKFSFGAILDKSEMQSFVPVKKLSRLQYRTQFD